MNTGRWLRRDMWARAGRVIAVTGVMTMVVGVLPGLPAQDLAYADDDGPAARNPDRKVSGKTLKVEPRKPGPPSAAPVKVNWPEAGTVEVDVPKSPSGSARTGSENARPVQAGKLPVWVGAPAKGGRGGAIAVRVLDRAATARAGIDGLMISVADGADQPRAQGPGRVQVRLDYSGFAQAFGGTYGTRLRLVKLPACAVTSPDRLECRTRTPIQTHNDGEDQILTADVDVPATVSGQDASGVTVLAAVAGADSSQGDYKATSLAASATWNAGGNSGGFSWSYPMRVPPVPGGLTPEVKIDYSSQSMDGRTANTNNQPSWVGEGFDLWPGYIERRYKPCADDGAPQSNGIDPGDQCWAYDNAVVTWNGKGGELIKASDGTWRLQSDDGTKFERLNGNNTDTNNGDDDNEYWKVTTTDGTRYYFGKNRLPGWSSGKAETNSTWTVPVFGNDSGEPCHASQFADSWCRQAWRWNLDYVVDTNGNVITYSYAQETNHYGRNVTPSADTSYVRGGYLTTISYGLRETDPFATAPARVTFGTTERCIGDSTFCDPGKITTNPERWPDVPWDQNCKDGDQCAMKGLIAPTFWSRKRLTGVTTQVLKADGTYRDVDSWELAHLWGEADIDQALLLESIQHTGKATSAPVTLPKVTFTPVQLTNRLDKSGDDIPPFIKYRVGTIYDESGGQIDINYSDEECTLSTLPTPETNTKRCFPVYWQPAGHDDPIRDWFHKYVVTQVVQSDRTGGAPDMLTDYSYLGGAAWHYDDDDGMTKTKYKTWSQWRGYGKVQVTTGGWNDPKAQTDTYYLRGMDGDRQSPTGGTKSVQVSDGEGGTYTDHEALAGFVLKTVRYTEPDGAVHDKRVNTPWRVQTASRIRPWGTTTANVVNIDTTRTWTAMDGGTWRQTKTDTDYKGSSPGIGRVESVNDLGDVADTGDDQCTRTSYADNTTDHMVDYPSRVQTVSVACTTTPGTEHVISDVRTYYDGGGFGAAPTKGDVTKIDKIADHDGTTPVYVTQTQTTYDDYGRPLTVTDAMGNTTTTAYTDTAGITTRTVVTSPRTKADDPASAHVTTTDLDPAWGQPILELAPSNLRTELAYDALGRLTGVWRPNRNKAAGQTPNVAYEYQITDGQIVAVTTKTLKAGGLQRASYELYDGWLRPRQTQADGPGGGRLITDTFYDSRGNVARKYDAYYNTGAPAPTLVGVNQDQVESQTAYTHDGLGRITLERFLVGNGTDTGEKWRTTTTYGGNWTAVTPPEGGTPTMEITNARGHVTERRQYQGSAPSGAYDATTYTYTPVGRLETVTNPAGQTWTYSYDLRGREIATDDPDKGTSTATFDDLDRQTSVTDARGKTVFTRYDVLGRKTETREDSSAGPLLSTWEYDTVRKGQLTSATRYSGGQPYTIRYSQYDVLDRPTRQNIIIPTTEGALGGTYTFGTTYNLDDTVATTGYGSGGGLIAETVQHTYDDLARPTGLQSNLSTYVTNVEYSYTGKPTKQTLSTGAKKAWQTYTWELGTQRLQTSRVDREGIAGTDRNATYHYDQIGNIRSISDDSRAGIDTQCFAYDHLRRLTQAWTQNTTTCADTPSTGVIGGPAPYWHSYTYDTAGNRQTETRHGLGGEADTTRTYTNHTGGNKLAQMAQTGGDGTRADTFGYDATGNMTTRTVDGTTQTLEWNTEGDLAKITQGGDETTFVYTADGDRLLRKDPTGTTLYLPGTELRLPAGATSATATRYYVLGDQTVAMRTTGGVQFLAADHQGTSQLAINAASQATVLRRFTPFGQTRWIDEADTWPDDKGFVGGVQDPTGLTHLGARQYDPATGRFLSVDPLIDTDDPQQMNGYNYANNSPVTFSDPDGLIVGDPGGGCAYWTTAGCGTGKNWLDDYLGIIKPSNPGTGGSGYWSPNPLNPGSRYFTGSPTRRTPVKVCGWTCKIQSANNYLAGLETAYIKYATPFGAPLMIPGVEDWAAQWGGFDPDSRAYGWGERTFDTVALVGGGSALGRGGLRYLTERELPRIFSASTLGVRLYNMPIIGKNSRLFGDVYSGAAKNGLLNRPGKTARYSIGWSGQGVREFRGTVGVRIPKKAARTVFRMKIAGRKVDLWYGPWR